MATDLLAASRDLSRRDPENPRFLDDTAVALEMIGQGDVALGAKDDARLWYVEALAIRRALRKRDPLDSDWARGLTLTLGYLAELDISVGRYEDARQSLQECVDADRHESAPIRLARYGSAISPSR